jgi:hypothetical protein
VTRFEGKKKRRKDEPVNLHDLGSLELLALGELLLEVIDRLELQRVGRKKGTKSQLLLSGGLTETSEKVENEPS